MDIHEVHRLLDRLGYPAEDVRLVTGSFHKKVFLIGETQVLRPCNDLAKEVERFRRIDTVGGVPRLLHAGLGASDGNEAYLLLSLVPGTDYLAANPGMTVQQNGELGVSLSRFLDRLHAIRGSSYDIGHYIPWVSPFEGTWRDGHRSYWERLRDELPQGSRRGQEVLRQALAFLDSHSDALTFQQGATLLHNDLHPQNIIVDRGVFSGVIDWECSQFGEPDFELCHLVHWTLYPPLSGVDFRGMLQTLGATSPTCTQAPDLGTRLTLYQIEHELAQWVWGQGANEAERISRMEGWLAGAAHGLLGRNFGQK